SSMSSVVCKVLPEGRLRSRAMAMWRSSLSTHKKSCCRASRSCGLPARCSRRVISPGPVMVEHSAKANRWHKAWDVSYERCCIENSPGPRAGCNPDALAGPVSPARHAGVHDGRMDKSTYEHKLLSWLRQPAHWSHSR